eukprot:GFKZ01003276.1.p1 GENE.GFKZ01003276.1~~GFKZ01003276.1.p1  ORF type:complete len:799 (-),score=179.77 GFKZ01003276.1:1467-3863(-)
MNNSTQAFADGNLPSSDANPASTCSPPTAHIPESDNIRQAQREWRLAKRRELEAKARKKIRRASLSSPSAPAAPPLPHTQPPHVHATTLYGQIPAANASSPHQVHISHGSVFAPPSEVQQVHMQPISHSQPVGTAALHQVNQTHPAITPQLKPDPDQAMVVSAALQTHLNVNAKRPRSAMEDAVASSAVADAEGVAAANAAAVHAAASASPGDAQFANTIPMPTGVGPVVAAPLVTDSHMQQQQDAHHQAMRQFEAQRKWREMKRKEIAMKRAKGAGSKRGRKKSRVDVIQPAHSAATAQLQASVSMAIAAVPSTIGSSGAVQANLPADRSKDTASHGANGGVNGQGLEDDSAAMYVQIAPPPEPSKDLGGSNEQMKDIEHPVEETMQTPLPGEKPASEELQQPQAQSKGQIPGETIGQKAPKTEHGEPTDKASDQTIDDAVGELAASNAGQNDDVPMVEPTEKPKDDSPVNQGRQSGCGVPNEASESPLERSADQTVEQAMDQALEQPTNQSPDNPSDQPVDVEMPTSDEAEIAAQRIAEAAELSARAEETVKQPDEVIDLAADDSSGPEDQNKADGEAEKNISEAPELETSPLLQGESKDIPKKEGQDAKSHMIGVDGSKPIAGEGEMNAIVKEDTKTNVEVESTEQADSEQDQADSEQDRFEGEKRIKDDPVKKDLHPEASEDKPLSSIESVAGTAPNEAAVTAIASETGAEEEREDENQEVCTDSTRREESEGRAKQNNDALETGEPGEGQRPPNSDDVHDEDAEAKADEFPGVNGEDIMTAAAWQSLDSISHP